MQAVTSLGSPAAAPGWADSSDCGTCTHIKSLKTPKQGGQQKNIVVDLWPPYTCSHSSTVYRKHLFTREVVGPL